MPKVSKQKTRRYLTKAERFYIKSNHSSMTVEQMAEDLGLSVDRVQGQVKKLVEKGIASDKDPDTKQFEVDRTAELEKKIAELTRQNEQLQKQLPQSDERRLGQFGVRNGTVVMTGSQSHQDDEKPQQENTQFFEKYGKNIHRPFKDGKKDSP